MAAENFFEIKKPRPLWANNLCYDPKKIWIRI
jgi:hypothetical protein